MVIRDYNGDTPPATTDPRWVDELTLNVSIRYVDCEQDFVDFTNADNFSLLTQNIGEQQLDDTLYRYQIDSTIFPSFRFLSVNYPA